MAALQKPLEFNAEQVVTLRIGGAHYSLEENKRDAIITAVRGADDDEAADQLADGRQVRRQVGSPTVLAIMALGIMPWRLELHCPAGSINTDLGYNPMAVKSSPLQLPRVAKLKTNFEECFVLSDNGWSCRGWDSSVAARFTESLHENELQHPGTYRNLIKSYREACKAAPVFDDSAMVQFRDPVPNAHIWVLDSYQRVTAGLCITSPASVPLAAIRARLEADSSLSYDFHSASENGLITLDRDAPLVATAVADEPVFTVPKPTTGMLVPYGGVTYKLLSPVAPRKGWQVERISDGVVFRMKSKQIAESLHNLAQQMFVTAKEKIAQAVSLVAVPQEQQALF